MDKINDDTKNNNPLKYIPLLKLTKDINEAIDNISKSVAIAI